MPAGQGVYSTLVGLCGECQLYLVQLKKFLNLKSHVISLEGTHRLCPPGSSASDHFTGSHLLSPITVFEGQDYMPSV